MHCAYDVLMDLLSYLEWDGARQRGALTRLARRMGVQPILVHQWANRTGGRQIPLARCVALEIATGGLVTCEEARPDMASYFAYLRGRADPKQSTVTATPADARQALAA